MATVSAVINGISVVRPELKARVEKAIRDIGYKRNAVTRSLKMGTTRTIASILVLSVVMYFQTLIHIPEVITGLGGAA